MTTVLTAESPVIPCETYRLKLIIADVGDPFYDSAVFLEAGSFSAGLVTVSEPSVTAQNGGAANAAVEGCSDGTLIFSRLDSTDISQPLTVYFNISPTGTATFGLDYSMPTDSFIIEAGQFSDTLLIDIFEDALNEGTESIILRVDNTCECLNNTSEFLIVDPTPLELQLPDPDTACQGTPIDLIPTVNGGEGGYNFSWSDGSIDSVLNTVYTAGDSLYILTVADACQQTTSDTIRLTAPLITATISGSYALCSGGSVVVPVILSGATSYEIVVNENGSPVNYSGGPDTIFLTYSSPQNISLISVDGDNCPGQTSGNAVISQPNFGLTATVNPVACFGAASGSIALSVSGNPADYQFDWADPAITGTNPTGLTAANYPVSISNSNGCTLDTFFVITQPLAALSLGLQSSQGQDCSQAGSAALDISGGTGSYVIDWGDAGAMTLQRNDLIGGQNYSVSVTDDNNCTTSLTVTIADDRRTMDATIGSQSGLQLSCSTPQLNLGAAFNSGPVNYRWRDQNGLLLSVTDSVLVGQPGTYSLVVVDSSSGCLDSQSVVVTQSNDFLTLETGGPHLLDCNDPSITITATTPGFSDPVNYSWIAPSGMVISTADSITGISVPGTYQLTAEQVDNGCISTTAVIITEDFQAPALELLLTPLSCSVDTATLLVQNPAGSYQYNWSSQNGTISGDVNTASLRVLSAATYQLRATDPANGCFLDTLVEINRLGDSLVASAGPDISLDCEAQMAIISGSSSPILSGTSYRWLDDTGLEISDQRELEVTATGNYTLEVIHPVSGCVSSDAIRVENEGPESVLYTLLPAPCVEIGATLTINEVVGGLPPYRYFYDDEAVILNDSGAISGLTAGSHTLTVEDANGCQQSVPLLLFEPRTFEGEATAVSIRLGEAVELGFSTNRDEDIVLISWSGSDELSCVNCSNPLIELPLASFTARVQLVDDEGCELFLNQEVFVDRRELVYAPTAFSPGILDGINDKFTLFGDPRFVTNVDYLRIFDRWGGMIWSNSNFPINDERAGWDGTQNGEALSGNAYIFSALVTYFDGSQEVISGNINIIR
jgi:gliding motility-associated-like protein